MVHDNLYNYCHWDYVLHLPLLDYLSIGQSYLFYFNSGNFHININSKLFSYGHA